MKVTDDQYKVMVISHDKHIDTLAGSIESLATSVGSTNNKLDNVIDVITEQNVLIERVNNLDNNVTESFKRAWTRISKLEETSEGGGCAATKGLSKDHKLIEEKLKVVNKRIDNTSLEVHDISEKLGEYIQGATVKWGLGLLLFYAVAFGIYTVNAIHDDETLINTYIAKYEEHSKYVARRLEDLVIIMRRHSANKVDSNK